jgi:hypothetical protein
MADNKISAATGTATATENPVEKLMAQEVINASKEAEAIWNDQSLKIEERQKLIAKVMSDDAIRARKLKARDNYRAEQLRRSHESSAAAQVEALKKMAKNL